MTVGNSLGLFAKYWQPGRVKTRLAKSIGDSAASKAYQILLGHHIRRFGTADHQSFIVYSPNTAQSLDSFQSFTSQNDSPNWQFVPQVDADLGQRMNQFFTDRFDAGDRRVVVIGSDAPQLTLDDVAQAFELLADSEVVFGPSTDGGYYLVGLNRPAPEVFEQIQWSTEQVLEQSLEKCRENDLQAKLLRPLTDIDEGPDLVNLLQWVNTETLESTDSKRCAENSQLFSDLTAIEEVARLMEQAQ